MARLKTSFITTVYNEEKTIIKFLESLFTQSVLPDEVIIVDAGSTDKTVELISSFLPKKESNYTLKLLFQKGNRSVGRNTAIRAATHEIILCSDGGCVLDTNWIKNIITPFKEKSIDVVGGFYKPLVTSIFEKCLATYTCTMPDKIDRKNFLPSSRSIAFKKSVWEKVGGYPEYLDTCEDLIFDKNLQKIKARFIFVQDAIVYWPQRKNLLQATRQFFSYAKGDGEAHFFRKQTPLLFARYLFGLLLVLSGITLHQRIFLEAIPILLVLYIFWSIGKNYKYIMQPLAMFWLPILQIVSDFTVMSGTGYGLLKSIHSKEIISRNKTIIAILFIYLLFCLLSISWGIPNNNHPFTYHMDEWAQAQSIRSLFKHGTPNINGSSHGVVLQYFLSGLYLIPFILLHIINPFLIKSPFDFLNMQERLFIILRFNTVLNGILAIIVCSYIAKRFLKTSTKLTALFLTATPLFILPSMIFKYDIALVFWISLSLLFTYIFAENPTKKNFIIVVIISALTCSVKLSALPLIPLLITTFFLFYRNALKRLTTLLLGIFVYIGVFLIAGIPDVILGTGNYSEWFRANIFINPIQTTKNVHLGSTVFSFFITQQYPALFGHVSFFIFILSIIICIFFIYRAIRKKTFFLQEKQTLILLLGVFFFAISLLPLQIGANSNRLLVFLPFLALLSSIVISKLYREKYRKPFLFLFTILMLIQIAEVLSWVSVRLFPTPQETASVWIKKTIPQGSTIGIENVPIFQSVPDIILQDFYHSQYFPKTKTQYTYEVIDGKTTTFPKFVILSNAQESKEYFYTSDKKTLEEKILRLGYTQRNTFIANLHFYSLFNGKKSFYFGAIVPTPLTITIYSLEKTSNYSR